MQQIERYGVIALVFLLVTIVAISFWGDSKSPGFWSRLTGKNQAKPAEVAHLETPVLPPQIADPNLPLAPGAPATTPETIGSLGGTQPVTTIDAPATGISTLQGPEGSAAIGQQPLVSTQQVPMPGAVIVPPPVAQPAPAVAAASEYVVQRGDALARIAKTQLGAESRWHEIAALNPGIDPKSLSVGQKLRMPTGAAMTVANPTSTKSTPKVAPKVSTKSVASNAAPKKTEKASSGARTCTVQRGDTLRSIARRELGDEKRWKEIANLNPSVDPSKLAIGMRVKLPKAGGELLAATSKPTTTATSKPQVR